MSSYSSYLLETFVTLAGVCALAAVVLWTARRMGVSRSTGPIELRGHLPLDARRAIYLVKVGTTIFVVGVGEGGFTKLGEIADASLPEAVPARRPTFAQVFARARGSPTAASRLGNESEQSETTGAPAAAAPGAADQS